MPPTTTPCQCRSAQLCPCSVELSRSSFAWAVCSRLKRSEANWRNDSRPNGFRRWLSLSENGGRTWTPVRDLRYDTGEQFYSASAYAMLLRHSRTGRLYWFGNITPAPPDGNRPRCPLYIAEVDESIPALKKDTLSVIDDYDTKHDSPEIQLSNFKLMEDRETGEIELYMTRYGERSSRWLHADAYKYTITLL